MILQEEKVYNFKLKIFSKLTSMSKLTTPVDLLLGFFFLVTGFSWVGVAAPLPAPPTSESVPEK